MIRMTTRAMLLLALSLPICVWGLQTQPSQKPPAVSSSAPPLPPPPELAIPKDAPPPQPPPPPTGYPKHYDYSLPVAGPTFQGAYLDIPLPPGQIQSVKWVAVGPAQSNVSEGVEVFVYSPSLYLKPSPSGMFETFIGPAGGNMRVLARRKNYTGGFLVNVSIDLGQPQ
jgi:hypothetical protein